MASGELGYDNLQPHRQASVDPGHPRPPSGPRRGDASHRRPPANHVGPRPRSPMPCRSIRLHNSPQIEGGLDAPIFGRFFGRPVARHNAIPASGLRIAFAPAGCSHGRFTTPGPSAVRLSSIRCRAIASSRSAAVRRKRLPRKDVVDCQSRKIRDLWLPPRGTECAQTLPTNSPPLPPSGGS